jgi:hypothetical protein
LGSDDEGDDESEEDEEEEVAMEVVHEFKIKGKIGFFQSNKDFSKVFMIVGDGNDTAAILDTKSGGVVWLTNIGTEISLRYNSYCYSKFVGTYLDSFQQRMIANFTMI